MLGCGLYCNSFIHALEEIANVSYCLGDYKTYKMIDKDNNVFYKDYRVHYFIRENGEILQRYSRTLDVLDNKDYSDYLDEYFILDLAEKVDCLYLDSELEKLLNELVEIIENENE